MCALGRSCAACDCADPCNRHHSISQSVSLTLLIAGSTALTISHTATGNYLFFESAAAVPRMHPDTINRTYAEDPCGLWVRLRGRVTPALLSHSHLRCP